MWRCILRASRSGAGSRRQRQRQQQQQRSSSCCLLRRAAAASPALPWPGRLRAAAVASSCGVAAALGGFATATAPVLVGKGTLALTQGLTAAPEYTLVWGADEIRAVLDKYVENRQLENMVAAAAIYCVVAADFAMISGTGLLGAVFSAGAVVAYVACHLEHVNGDPDGRLRFIDVSPSHEELLGLLEYHNTLQEATLLPRESTKHQRVERVGKKVAAATFVSSLAVLHNNDDGGDGRGDDDRDGRRSTGNVDDASGKSLPKIPQWEFHVIDSEECNAFVLPGGKVFVHSGLLDSFPTDEELAVILGHEAGHVQARHTAERLSMQRFPNVLKIVLTCLAVFGVVPIDAGSEILVLLKTGGIDLTAYYLVALPYSRKHEREADALGGRWRALAAVCAASCDDWNSPMTGILLCAACARHEISSRVLGLLGARRTGDPGSGVCRPAARRAGVAQDGSKAQGPSEAAPAAIHAPDRWGAVGVHGLHGGGEDRCLLSILSARRCGQADHRASGEGQSHRRGRGSTAARINKQTHTS
jgi:hypothetical protein